MPMTAVPSALGARRLARTCGPLPLALAIAAILAEPGSAQETPGGPDLSGRWHDERRAVTLDISSCGAEEWCGVEVREGGCGARVLRLATPRPVIAPGAFEGRLDFAGPGRRYAVRATFSDGAISMIGDDGARPFLRRTMPLELHLVRTGPATCRADPQSS